MKTLNKIEKNGLNITITSNFPSQSAIINFREKLFLIYQSSVDRQLNVCYNRTINNEKECSICRRIKNII